MTIETPEPEIDDTPYPDLNEENRRLLRFSQSLFIISLATLPYFFYVSIAGLLVCLGCLIVQYRVPCLDKLTTRCVGAIAFLLILSSIDAYDSSEAYLQLANFLPFLLLFAYLPGLLNTLEILENLAIALVLSTIPMNLVAMGEFFLKASFLPQDWQSVGWLESIRNAPHKGRAMVMFDHPNVMASYLVMVLGLALGLLIMQINCDTAQYRPFKHQSQDLPHNLPDDLSNESLLQSTGQLEQPLQTQPYGLTQGFSTSSLLIWAVAFILIGIFCTGSRNGIAIAFSQLFVFMFMVRLDQRVLIAIAFMMSLIVAAIAGFGLGVRRLGLFNLSDDPRIGVWTIAVDLMQERPWLGWGLGNFKLLYPPRLINPEYTDVFHPHNIWLLLGSEAGIVVMILINLFVAFICYRVVRNCLINPSNQYNESETLAISSERALATGYLLAFWGCLGFALFDVTFYDVRVNALNWTLLASLYSLPFVMVGKRSENLKSNSEL